MSRAWLPFSPSCANTADPSSHGLGMDAQPITTPLGSYAALYPWYALVASAHAAILGATIMAKEKRDHSADFLFTKPVPVPGSSARDCSPQCSISSRLRSSPRCSPW